MNQILKEINDLAFKDPSKDYSFKVQILINLLGFIIFFGSTDFLMVCIS